MAEPEHVAINLQPMEATTGQGRGRDRSVSPLRARRDVEAAAEDAEPFFNTERPNTDRRPPRADPENDLEDDGVDVPVQQPGVDDGFYIPTNQGGPTKSPRQPGNGDIQPNGNVPRRRFPTVNDYPEPSIININGVDTVVPDVNVYQHKKTLAQGMMDLALLSANANQLRYVLESYTRHPYYYVSVIFISFSLILQVAVGIGLIWNSRYNVKNQEQICKANKINNMTVIGIFLITIVNVFISAFGVADPPPDINS